MEGERVVFVEEGQPGQYLKLIVRNDIDDSLLEALEGFVKHQRKRLEASAISTDATGQSESQILAADQPHEGETG